MLNVVFASHNGARTLKRMLKAFEELIQPEQGWKIIAVNNASTDDIAQILQEAAARLPLTVLYCKTPGKNRSLNMALDHIDGDLIILTDDDIIPRPDWLVGYAKLAENKKTYDIFGGLILPDWPVQPSRSFLDWVPVPIAYALTPEGTQEGPIAPGLVWGANMAVRRRVFDAGVRFDDNIGPAPGAYIMGSETEFTRRATSLGYMCWFSKDIVVAHQIREQQLSEKWVLQRAFRFGRGTGISELTTAEVRTLFGVPRWLWRAYAKTFTYRCICWLFSSRSAYLQASWDLQVLRGRIHQARVCRDTSNRHPTAS